MSDGYLKIPEEQEEEVEDQEVEEYEITDEDISEFLGYKGPRAEAIERGDLRDVTSVGLEVGFLWHIAVTKYVWDDCVAWSEDDSDRQIYQTERMRLVEVLRMAAFCIRIGNPEISHMDFVVARIPRDGRSKRAKDVNLKVVAHYDDAGRRVLTVFNPES